MIGILHIIPCGFSITNSMSRFFLSKYSSMSRVLYNILLPMTACSFNGFRLYQSLVFAVTARREKLLHGGDAHKKSILGSSLYPSHSSISACIVGLYSSNISSEITFILCFFRIFPTDCVPENNSSAVSVILFYYNKMSRVSTADNPIPPPIDGMPPDILQLNFKDLRSLVRQILREDNIPIRFVDQIDRRGQYVRLPNGDIRQVPIANASRRALLNLLLTYTQRNREEGERNEMEAEDMRVNPPRVRDLLRTVEGLRQRRPQGFSHEPQEREDMMNEDYLLQKKLGMISRIPTQPLGIPIGRHPKYKKYFMMKRSNMALPLIQRIMLPDGLSRAEMDMIASLTSDSIIPVEDEQLRQQILQETAEQEREFREEEERVAALRRQQEEEMRAQLERDRALLGEVDPDQLRDAMARRRAQVRGEDEEEDDGVQETKGSGFRLRNHARRIFYRRFF
jgi:hypothetical protein